VLTAWPRGQSGRLFSIAYLSTSTRECVGERQTAWENFAAARDTFNFLEADAFTGLEQLLGVLN